MELRGLTPEHYEALSIGSAISDEVIENRGYKSLRGLCDALQNFDAYQVQSPGLWLPGWTVTGERTAGQYRPDVPRTVTSEKGEPRVLKYETPAGASNYLDVHPMILDRIRNSTEPLFITEGIKKTDSVVSRGLLCIGLTGIWNWKGRIEGGQATRVLPDFDEIPWKGRIVVIAFDSDILQNDQVKMAADRLGDMLRRRGAMPHDLDWEKLCP